MTAQELDERLAELEAVPNMGPVMRELQRLEERLRALGLRRAAGEVCTAIWRTEEALRAAAADVKEEVRIAEFEHRIHLKNEAVREADAERVVEP